ncbi:MAG: hypothetical protein DFNUSKGM_001296, partial [Candidatus Fervidibacter sacchari]
MTKGATKTQQKPKLILKTPDEIARMREAGVIAYHALKAAKEAVQPGITPKELDAIAESV